MRKGQGSVVARWRVVALQFGLEVDLRRWDRRTME
jgi:hypothetical protein